MLATRYYRRVVGEVPVQLGELSRELSEGVKQLDFLLKSSYVLHEQHLRLGAGRGPSPDFELWQYTDFVLDLYASMFFYVGHRTQVILRSKKQPLLGISAFQEAAGIRDVRNSVPEHPRSADFISIAGTAGHSHYGPLVRPSRDGKGLSNDSPWLFKSAEELEITIREVLIRAHAFLDAKTP